MLAGWSQRYPRRDPPGKRPLPRRYRRFAAAQPHPGTVGASNQEAVMSHPISPQHPAVVLRSQYVHVRALLAIAMIAVLSLTVAVVILASASGTTNTITSAPASAIPAAPVSVQSAPGQRYDGGPDEGTRGPNAAPLPSDTRYDGGPEEGTVGPGH
jgi:hypothetical protein